VRLLLDTHIMLWWALGDARLSVAAREAIDDDGTSCAVSVASLWEVVIKSALGRGLPEGVTAAGYRAMIEEAALSLVNVTADHAMAVSRLSAAHGDPFDRLMVAQAAAEGMTFLTADRQLAAYGDHVRVM
jgi:PIN domain nuclease of toxin-antitoxin system